MFFNQLRRRWQKIVPSPPPPPNSPSNGPYYCDMKTNIHGLCTFRFINHLQQHLCFRWSNCSSHSFVTRWSTDYARCKQFIWCEILIHFYVTDTRVVAIYWLWTGLLMWDILRRRIAHDTAICHNPLDTHFYWRQTKTWRTLDFKLSPCCKCCMLSSG
jgi:hypothetical protein